MLLDAKANAAIVAPAAAAHNAAATGMLLHPMMLFLQL